MKGQTLEQTAEELGLSVTRVSPGAREKVWNFISRNIDRLRPAGFDGHTLVHRPEDTEEIHQLLGG